MSSIEWREIPWAPAYQVSSQGDVRKRINISHPERNKPYARIRPFNDKNGYLRAQVSGRKWHIHRLVYAAFIGSLKPGMVVCHRDGSRTNNTPENLLQATQRENIAHKVEHGTHQIGERHGSAHHSVAQASAVHAALRRAPRSKTGRLKKGAAPAIAQALGVGVAFVYEISAGKSWGHAR